MCVCGSKRERNTARRWLCVELIVPGWIVCSQYWRWMIHVLWAIFLKNVTNNLDPCQMLGNVQRRERTTYAWYYFYFTRATQCFALVFGLLFLVICFPLSSACFRCVFLFTCYFPLCSSHLPVPMCLVPAFGSSFESVHSCCPFKQSH